MRKCSSTVYTGDVLYAICYSSLFKKYIDTCFKVFYNFFIACSFNIIIISLLWNCIWATVVLFYYCVGTVLMGYSVPEIYVWTFLWNSLYSGYTMLFTAFNISQWSFTAFNILQWKCPSCCPHCHLFRYEFSVHYYSHYRHKWINLNVVSGHVVDMW